jgi:hypothetical protein
VQSPTTPRDKWEKNLWTSRKRKSVRFPHRPATALEERKRDDFRVREALYGFVALSAVGVEMGVSVVDEAEEHSVRASSVWARRGVRLSWAILCSLVRGDYDGPLSISYRIHATHI